MGHPVYSLSAPYAIAHRGGAAEGLENAASAFRQAISLGIRYLETDLQVSADGVCVISHDPTLDRTTDSVGRITDLTWAQISRARIGGVEPVLRLEEFLEEFADVYINLDLKTDALVPAFVRALRNSDHLARICVGSMRTARLDHVRAEFGSALATSLGPREVARLKFLGRHKTGAGSVVAAQVPERVGRLRLIDPRFMGAANDARLQVHVWTVNDPAQMKRLLELGVAGLMTDRPSVALAVIADFISGSKPH